METRRCLRENRSCKRAACFDLKIFNRLCATEESGIKTGLQGNRGRSRLGVFVAGVGREAIARMAIEVRRKCAELFLIVVLSISGCRQNVTTR